MSEPVELTEAQQQQTDHDDLADLIHEAVTSGGDHHIEYDLAYAIAGCIVRSEWLMGHEAAARREALLEARDYLSEQEQFDAADLVRLLLAEPERDEEGGR